MALTRLDLSIELTNATDCSDITLTDDTGNYPTAAEGYGLPSGITINNVSSLIITVYLNGGIYITYTCIVSSGVITSCLLSINGGTGTEIVTLLASTTFPMTDFSLFSEDYGVTLPTLEDGIVEVDYNIAGVGSGEEAFNYLTDQSTLLSCSLCCCLKKALLSLDPSCSCESKKMDNYIKASTYLEIAEMNMNIGKNDNALIAFNKATALCDDCENCGC